MRRLLLVLVTLVLSLFAGPACAEVIDSESFEAPFDIGTAPDWVVEVGQEPNINVADSSLTYNRGAVSVDGGTQALEIGPGLPSATTNNLVDWSFTETTADDVWFSFLLQPSETSSTALPDTNDNRDFFQIFLTEAGGGEGQSLSMLLDNSSGSGTAPQPSGGDHNFRARVGASGQNTTGFTDNGQLLLNTPGETQLVVGHIQKVGDEYETVSIFANPGTPEPPVAPTAMATFGGVNISSLAQLTVRISALEMEDIYLLDAVTIGESYEDVVSTNPDFLLGDFDSNGMLDETDFGTLADNLFTGTTYEQGDYNFSGAVDLQDFIDFRAAFTAGAGGLSGTNIPEPTSLLLLALGSALVCLLRRHRGQP